MPHGSTTLTLNFVRWPICAGVTAALQDRPPWELRVAGYRPTRWTVADVVLTSRVVGYIGLAQSQGDMERLLVEMVQAGVSRPHESARAQVQGGALIADSAAPPRLEERR